MLKQLILKDDLKSTLDVNKYLQLENKCQEILKDDTIGFIGIINNMGKFIAGGYDKDPGSFETDEKRNMLYMQMVLEISMRKEFDDTLGKINYVATNRDKVLMISIPMNDHVVLISAKSVVAAEKIITKTQVQELFQSEI